MELDDYKYQEVKQLKEYLATLTYRERVEFVSDVVAKTGIKRGTFFNWKSMACRIPAEAREAIESVAGQIIFIHPQANPQSCH